MRQRDESDTAVGNVRLSHPQIGQYEGSRPPRVRVSAMASVGLVLSLVACCPFFSVFGGVLGLMAYRRIALSDGRLGGRRIALTAIFLGAGLGLLSGVGWTWLARSVDRSLRESVTVCVPAFVRESQQGNAPAALGVWDARAAPLDARSIARFGGETAARYGPMQAFRITSSVGGGSFLTPTLEVAGTFVFASVELPGSAVFSIVPSSSMGWPDLRLRSLTIDDPQRGRLQVPEPSPAASAPAMRADAPAASAPATGPQSPSGCAPGS
jgi:hypothetical protein